MSIQQGMDPDIFAQFTEQLYRYVRERLVPAEPDVIANDEVPADILQEMKDLGLFGMTMPEEFGGAGLNTSQYIEASRILTYAAPAFRAVTSINVGMIATALTIGGTPEQQEEWFARLAAGEVGCFGLTEPGSGSDSAAMQTFARRDGDDFILNGTKRYITNAPEANMALIMARTNKETLPRNAHVSAFLVPMDLPGISVGKRDKKMGQSGVHIADIIMEDVRLPASAMLGGAGGEGKGFSIAMQSLDKGRLSVAAASCGYARRMLDSALRYASERKAFGETIANFQLVQAMLADSQAELYAGECMLRDAAARVDRGESSIIEAASTKMFCSEMCGRVADRCVQIYGGAGYLAEYEAERFYRDARIFRIYEGTTQIMQLVIAKNMLRQFATGL